MQSSRRKGYGDERKKIEEKRRAEGWKTARRKVEHEMCPEVCPTVFISPLGDIVQSIQSSSNPQAISSCVCMLSFRWIVVEFGEKNSQPGRT